MPRVRSQLSMLAEVEGTVALGLPPHVPAVLMTPSVRSVPLAMHGLHLHLRSYLVAILQLLHRDLLVFRLLVRILLDMLPRCQFAAL